MGLIGISHFPNSCSCPHQNLSKRLFNTITGDQRLLCNFEALAIAY